MENLKPNTLLRVGVDLAKRVDPMHAVNQLEVVALTKAMTPGKFFDWCRSLPTGCRVAMESCSAAHCVGRRLVAMGLNPRTIAAHHVKPFRAAGAKAMNDANDAAAICEAAYRPHLHSVPIKTAQQQGIVALHRFGEDYKECACQKREVTTRLTQGGRCQRVARLAHLGRPDSRIDPAQSQSLFGRGLSRKKL